MTGLRVAVVGGAGYAGGELLRLLLQHPEVSECVATSRSQAGKAIADVHPSLAPLTETRFSGETAGEVARGRDVVFLALEHGESSRVAPEVFAAGPGLVIDLAADFRVPAPRLYERYYGAHAAPDFVSRFVYGLADVAGETLRGATAIAAPGCFATSAQLALYPLAPLAAADPSIAPVLFAVTGSSGAGVQPKPTTHHPARAHNMFAYSVLSHRHEAEVTGAWQEWTGRPDAAARLIVHSGPFVRGIHLTLHARFAHPQKGDAARRYREAFAGRPFVRVLESPPELTHAVGSNYALLHAAESEDGRELQVSIVLDNLIKGAGGQGIQAMNLALGLPETAGLDAVGIFPC
ncbi:MAG TPA: N-acetyl-gamma-glutamyl-phosphate reductase [Gemmatimonadales bacterium]|nr:N-acetyl-gamma-glutamyl-phosphate reductase [Gemmatimonadales bacterium]